ncbi:MAG TPA: geranylgeranylglycerol-phosphate geranylgeranyltransferase [archaeon]|nr:geranylgeranylglycerol-phosphate geranylgeranyltransferase [archaeon]
MFAYIEILRPVNAVMTVVGVIVAAAIAGVPFNPLHAGIIFAALATFLQLGAGNTINDYFDREIDKTNKPLRPIPSGRISPQNAKIYAGILFAVSLALAWLMNIYAFAFAVFSLIVSYFYSANLKKTWLGHFVVSYLVASPAIFAALITESVPATNLLLFGLIFLINTGREVAKGIEDFKGDKKFHAHTLEIESGIERAAVVGIVFTLAGILLSPLPTVYGMRINTNYIYVIIVADIIFLYCAHLLFKSRKETLDEAAKIGARAQKFFKIGMAMAMVAFVAGIL